jgi:hypothetical protein
MMGSGFTGEGRTDSVDRMDTTPIPGFTPFIGRRETFGRDRDASGRALTHQHRLDACPRALEDFVDRLVFQPDPAALRTTMNWNLVRIRRAQRHGTYRAGQDWPV